MRSAIVPLLLLALLLSANAMPIRSSNPRTHKLPSSFAKDKCEICESHLSNAVHGGIDMIWMTTFMLEICPALLRLVCPTCGSDMAAICDAAADWLLIDIDNHVVPDGIYYCEKMGLSPPAHPSPPPPAAASARSLPPPSRPPLPCFCQAFAPSRPIPQASPSSTTSRCIPPPCPPSFRLLTRAVQVVQDKPPSYLVDVFVNYTVDAALSPGQIVLRLPNPLPSAPTTTCPSTSTQ
jgi:hypothetical protein